LSRTKFWFITLFTANHVDMALTTDNVAAGAKVAPNYIYTSVNLITKDKFGEAVETVWDAIERYDPKLYGWEWAPEDGPRFQFAPVGARGYIEGVPVREYKR